MPISKFQVPFADFKLLEVIDPEQFDANNAETVAKINEMIDSLNNDKMNNTDDFKGTWHGLLPGEVAEAINGGRLDILEPIVTGMESRLTTAENTSTATSSTVSELKGAMKNAQQEIANLNLFTDANNRVKNGNTFGTNFDTSFGMEVDFTRTNATSNLSITQTIVPVKSVTGFEVGEEVTIYDDVNLERVKITAISGTNLTVTALTKEFKVNALVARTMFLLDTIQKKMTFDGFNNGVKRTAMSVSLGMTSTSGQTTYGGVFPSIPFEFSGAKSFIGTKKMSIDMDVNIPYFDNSGSHYYYGKPLFSTQTNPTTKKGVVFGFTNDAYKVAGAQFDQNVVDDFNYLPDISNAFYVAFNTVADASSRVLLTTAKDFRKEFVGRTVNIKLVFDADVAPGSPTNGVKLFVNDVVIPLFVKQTIGTPTAFTMENAFKFFHKGAESTNIHSVGFGSISRFILYKDLTFTTPFAEYLFNSILPTTIVDSSGNNLNMNVALPSIPANAYVTYPEINPASKTVSVNDVRFKATNDSKEIGVWSLHGADLIAVEGKYGDDALELKSVNNEDQFIGSRATVSPSNVRLTFSKSANSTFPAMSRIIGGTF